MAINSYRHTLLFSILFPIVFNCVLLFSILFPIVFNCVLLFSILFPIVFNCVLLFSILFPIVFNCDLCSQFNFRICLYISIVFLYFLIDGSKIFFFGHTRIDRLTHTHA